jgi:sec-independent protein translocase protein TatC
MFEELKPHLVELRKRLGISVMSLLFFFVLAFIFYEPILTWVVQPLKDALPDGGQATTHQVGGVFFIALKVSFFASIIFSLPIILWQIWLFIAPGLYANEKKLLIPFVIGGTIMFLVGTMFAYYIVTPFGFEFLLSFGTFAFTQYINIEDYVGFFTKILFGFGVAFELPIVTMFLAIMGLVTDKSLKDFFKFAIVIIFIVSAMLTPPDVMTQLLMAGPLTILYGFSIMIARVINPYKEEPEDETVTSAEQESK